MSATLTLVPSIESNDKSKQVARIEAYTRQSLEDVPRKKVYNMIRFLNAAQQYESKDADILEARCVLSESVLAHLASFTPRMLMQVFPPDKKYDGARYKCTDYFTTMEAVEAHGADVPLGEKAFEFLFDYDNRHIRKFVVQYLGAMSDMRKLQGGKGIMEEWFEGQGMPLYYKGTDAYGREVMVNSQTGEASPIIKPKPRKPRWWRVIRGGESL